MSGLRVDGLEASFGDEAVLAGIGFEVPARMVLAVVGRSGCGKTTLLKAIAGLLEPDRGSVRLAGEEVGHLPPQRRGILYLSQDPLLFPHLDVRGNLGFGLRLRKVPAEEAARRVGAMLADLGLAEHAAKRPHQLSGGQRQRVAFGRALIVNPPLLLLDEPFGALDGDTRAAMQALFLDAAARYRITAVFVTHDLKEAITVGGAWGHLAGGALRTFGTLRDFVADPAVGVGDEIAFWRGVEGR